MKKTIMSFYLFVLSGTALGIFIIGVFVAPVIFAHEQFLHIALYNRFEAGLLMTKIFQRFNIVLAICGIMIMVIEGLAIARKETFKSIAVFAVLTLIEIAGFLFYFTPMILNYQALGEAAIATPEFMGIHNFAELDFKAMLLTITGLAFLRFSKAVKDNPCGCEDDDKN